MSAMLAKSDPLPQPKGRPLRLFFSYSPADAIHRDELERHLSALSREGLIHSFSDRLINAGEERYTRIRLQLDQSDLILVLLSPDYLSSDYLCDSELQHALHRHRTGESAVIPIVVRPVDWRFTPLGGLEALPRNGKPVTEWKTRDSAWLEVAQCLREAVRALHRESGQATAASRDVASGAVVTLSIPRSTANLERRGSPTVAFFEQVLRICQLREATRGHKVELHRSAAPRPYYQVAEVSYTEGGVVCVYALAVLKESLTLETLEIFCRRVHTRYEATAPGTISVLVCGGEPPGRDVLRRAHLQRIRVQTFSEYQGLIDFRAYLEAQTSALAADPVYPPSLYVPQRLVYSVGGPRPRQEEVALPSLVDWLSSLEGRFVVLLGDFGTGKTFLLHELARKLALEKGPVVPILIEMRKLEKASSLDVLVAQHMALAKMERFDLPAFRYMLAEGRIALLFDGFDELALRVSYERAADHLETLIQAAGGHAKVVISSRTQHFESDDQVKTELAKRLDALPMHRICRLLEFEKPQIRQFLVNLLGATKAAARYELIDEVQDLLGLSENPRMLGFISTISEEDLRLAKEKQGTITSAGLYQLILRRWLENEDLRANPPGIQHGLSIEDRWAAVTRLALRLWQRTERTVMLSELPAEVAAVVQDLARRQIDPDTAVHQVGSGTLLSRDQDGHFSFIHQSILEWLVARAAAQELKQQERCTLLEVRDISPLMADFLIAMAGQDRVAEWARQIIREVASDQALKNAMLVLGRMGLEAGVRINFAGKNLRGQNLAGRDLRQADLRGADLTEARLAKANLTGALLSGARLVHADLTAANLTDAELLGADLSFACLLHARLEGVRVDERTCLRAAKLIGATLDADLLERVDSFGAAPSDLACVEPMFASCPAACLAVAFSPDGRFLASGWANQRIRIHEVATGLELRSLPGHGASINSLGFSPDGRLLVTASDDKTARVWNFSSGSPLLVLAGHTDAVRSVAINRSGTRIATGCDDGFVRLWDAQSGTILATLAGPSARGIVGVAFSPIKATLLASCSQDGTVCLWDSVTGKLLVADQSRKGRSCGLAFRADGRVLAVGSEAALQLFMIPDEPSGTNANMVPDWQPAVIQTSYTITGGLCFWPYGRRIAVGALDQVICEPVATRDLIASEKPPTIIDRPVCYTRHQGAVNCLAVSPDGNLLASGSDDQTVCLWDCQAGRQVRSIEGWGCPLAYLCFHPSSSAVFLVDEVGMVRRWRIADREIDFLGQVNPGASRVTVAISSDAQTIAFAGASSTYLYPLTQGPLHMQTPIELAMAAQCMAFGRDLTEFALATPSGKLVMYTSPYCKYITVERNAFLCVALSPQAPVLAVGAMDGSIMICDHQTDAVLHRMHSHGGYIWSLGFSPDGTRLTSRSADKTLRVFDVGSGELLFACPGTGASLGNVVFSPDGALLATPSEESTIAVFDASSGQRRWLLCGHSACVRSVAFSPDGQWLASTGDDRTIRLWSLASGNLHEGLYYADQGWAVFDWLGQIHPTGELGGQFWGASGLCRFEADAVVSLFQSQPDDQGLFR